MKLTENFALEEFSKEKLTEYQIGLLRMLATQLQKLRDNLQEERMDPQKPVTIGISSGVRTMADYERLKQKGYHPSKTSDHFCGLQLDGKPCLGAADIYIKNCRLSYHDIVKRFILLDKVGVVDVGQIIWEQNPKTGAEWIHIGNDWTRIFQAPEVVEVINKTRKKYLMSLDNGVTYKEFK